MALTNDEWVQRLNERVPPTAILLGMKVIEVDSSAGRVLIHYDAKPEFCNPMGNVQGGFVAAMLDDAAALAAIVKAGQRIVIPTLEFKVSFLATAKAGRLQAEGRVVRLGRSIAFLEARLMDIDGNLLAVMSATAMPKPMPEKPNFVDNI